MKIFCLSIIIMLCFCFCASTPKVAEKKDAKITLFAHPKQGFMPLMVVFEAELINYKGSESMYICLAEEWDFGDGNKSSHQPDCKEETQIKSKFTISHTYHRPGQYRVRFSLGDKVIKSDVVRINVLQSGI